MTSDLEDHYIFYRYERYVIECNQRVPRQLSNSNVDRSLPKPKVQYKQAREALLSPHLLLDGSSVNPRF